MPTLLKALKYCKLAIYVITFVIVQACEVLLVKVSQLNLSDLGNITQW